MENERMTTEKEKTTANNKKLLSPKAGTATSSPMDLEPSLTNKIFATDVLHLFMLLDCVGSTFEYNSQTTNLNSSCSLKHEKGG
jgi:hypothetical protein